MKLSGSISIVGSLACMAAIHAPLSCHAFATAAGQSIIAEGEASSAPLAEWDADLYLHSPSTTEKFNVRALSLWTPPFSWHPVAFDIYLTLRATRPCLSRPNAWTAAQAATTTASRQAPKPRPSGSSILWVVVTGQFILLSVQKRSCACSRLANGVQVGATMVPAASRGARVCWARPSRGRRSSQICGGTAPGFTDSCPRKPTRLGRMLATHLATGTLCGSRTVSCTQCIYIL